MSEQFQLFSSLESRTGGWGVRGQMESWGGWAEGTMTPFLAPGSRGLLEARTTRAITAPTPGHSWGRTLPGSARNTRSCASLTGCDTPLTEPRPPTRHPGFEAQSAPAPQMHIFSGSV